MIDAKKLTVCPNHGIYFEGKLVSEVYFEIDSWIKKVNLKSNLETSEYTITLKGKLGKVWGKKTIKDFNSICFFRDFHFPDSLMSKEERDILFTSCRLRLLS